MRSLISWYIVTPQRDLVDGIGSTIRVGSLEGTLTLGHGVGGRGASGFRMMAGSGARTLARMGLQCCFHTALDVKVVYISVALRLHGPKRMKVTGWRHLRVAMGQCSEAT